MSLTQAVVDLDALYVAIDRRRRQRCIRWRDVAHEADVTPSLLTQLGQGHSMDVHNFARLMVWLGQTDISGYLLASHERAPARWRRVVGHADALVCAECGDCGLPVEETPTRRDKRHDHCGPLPHTGSVGGPYCERCA